MNKKLMLLSLILVFTVGLTACTSGGTDAELKVAMVTDEGGVNDQSFNQSAWEGLQEAKKDLNVDVDYQESEQTADYVPNFETLLDADNDLMFGIGYKLADATYNAAKNNPDKKYGIVDFSYEGNPDFPEGPLPNIIGIVFKQEQPSFLVGYIAGMMSETNKVGFVGGIESDVIWGFDYGYQAGVKYAALEKGVDIEVKSQYVGDFGDSSKGKSIAKSMYQQGMDVVFHAAGGAGDGVIEAGNEEEKWVIGVDRDQSDQAPDFVLTSAMKRVDIGVYNVTKDLLEGKFEGGTTVVYGLEDGGAVDIAPTSDKHVPKEILDRVEELKQEIIEGKIVVPYNEETFGEYIKGLN